MAGDENHPGDTGCAFPAGENRGNAGGTGEKPWMRSFGKLRALRKETARINGRIEAEFETIEPEEWA
jgi:hypothetical protein